MTWPDPVLHQFQSVPPTPAENDFNGPYNKLFSYLFPFDSPYTVVPQYLKSGSRDSSDLIMTFEVMVAHRPVFILELKSPEALRFVSSREETDSQIRRRMGDLCAYCPIPILHAVSAVGTRLCFYQLNTTDKEAGINPLAIPRHPTKVNDTAPKKRWNCDILDAEGKKRFRRIVEEIKEECAKLA